MITRDQLRKSAETAKGRILIADDDADFLKALTLRLRACGHDVEACGDGMHAFRRILDQAPDLAILDVNMPGENGLFVGDMLAQDQRLAPLPVVFISGLLDEHTVRHCESLGAYYIRKGPNAWQELSPLIDRLLNESSAVQRSDGDEAGSMAADRPIVLVIDDDPQVAQALGIRLRAYGVDVIEAHAGMQGFWMAMKERPDAIITDYTMPEGYGNYLLRRLKECHLTRDIPVFVLTGRTIDGKSDVSLERTMIAAGAAGYMNKPVEFTDLLNQLREHIDIPMKATARN